jgi:hypothetical protein
VTAAAGWQVFGSRDQHRDAQQHTPLVIEALDTDDISERRMEMRALGSAPLIVIPHGREGMFGLAAEREQVPEMRWRELQAQLVKDQPTPNSK